MSIFSSQTKKTLPIQTDPSHTITIRKLTGKEVEKAQADDAIGLAAGSTRSWAARMKAVAKAGDDAKALAALMDPLVGYDRFSIIRSGLLAWSYPESLKPIAARAAVEAKDGQPAQPAVEAYDAITDLDDEAADFIATQILRLTKPGLFATADEREADQKNG